MLGEDVTVLLSFCFGGHGELEPGSLCAWMIGMAEMEQGSCIGTTVSGGT